MKGGPMDLQDVLADSVLAGRDLFNRYLEGFGDSNHTRSAPNLPNHAAWILGHCALTMHRAADRIDPRPLPATDFVAGAAHGDAGRYGTESVAFGSDPASGAPMPTWARCRQIFDGAGQRLAATVRSAPTEDLMKPAAFFGGAELPAWNIVPRAVFHNGTHCGQLADLRRALGLPRLFS